MPTIPRKAVRIHPKQQSTSSAIAHRVAVFTAIDGTLIDARTFDPGASRTAVRKLLDAGVPVVPVSVMTIDELAPIAEDLGLRNPMIVEAGGAIARWRDREWEVEPWGPPADTLLDVVRDIEDRSGATLLVYSVMAESEAARVSGRSGEMLKASTRRRFSEPFVIESGELDAVREAAASIGFSVQTGRRFLHLCRDCDKGEAFTRVRDELHCEVTIALGGAPVDGEFLSRADIAIIVPGPDGRADAELVARVPNARLAPSPGPEGWASAVDEAWRALDAPKKGQRLA